MTVNKFAVVSMGLAMASIPSYGLALDDELKAGQEIFEGHCAVCHGKTGNGDGDIAELFKVKPKALSQLSKENGGEFPFERIYQTLKATKEVKGHGRTAMPVWGDYFRVEVLDDRSVDEEEAFVALGKMLSVIYYIETLQTE